MNKDENGNLYVTYKWLLIQTISIILAIMASSAGIYTIIRTSMDCKLDSAIYNAKMVSVDKDLVSLHAANEKILDLLEDIKDNQIVVMDRLRIPKSQRSMRQ